MQTKYRLFLITAFVFITFVIVQAASNPQATMIDQNVDAFPQVQINFSVPETLEGGAPLLLRDLEIWEGGEKNLHPFALLPPRTQHANLDLFVLIDVSSNTAPFDQVIQSNLKALVKELSAWEGQTQIHITAFGDGDLGVDESLITFNLNESNEFEDFIDALGFDSESPSVAHGFNKLYQFSISPTLPDSQKVALIINGSPFYDSRLDENTTYNLPETINQLASQDVTVFTVGLPFRFLHTLTTENTEDGSLNHALPGGYLGSFSTDLTLIPELLRKQHPENYVLLYHSAQNTSHPDPVQLFVLGEQAAQVSYPPLSGSLPGILHQPVTVHLGESANIQVQIQAPNQLISLVELFYLKEDGQLNRLVMQHVRSQKTSDVWTFETDIPAEDLLGKRIPYYVVLRTPEQVIESDIQLLNVIDYDEGIILTPFIESDHIRWELSGPTVDQGELYQFWMDDTLLSETADRFFEIPLGECDLYQTLKAKVFLNPSADHLRAGDWSLFSLPGEAYVGPGGQVSEEEIVEVILNCVQSATLSSEDEFANLQKTYQPDHSPGLQTGLSYLTTLMSGELDDHLPLYAYPPVYHLMDFIDEEDYDSSKSPDSKMQWRTLYQVIGHLRYTDDFLKVFEEALEDYAALLRGEVSI